MLSLPANQKFIVNITNHDDDIYCKCINTLNVIILNSETFPPAADITYESFFESAMHGTASSRLTPETSLAI